MKLFSNINKVVLALTIACLGVSCQQPVDEKKETQKQKEHQVFPYKMPTEKPDFPLSAAVDRMFDYPAPRVQDNELYSLFKYTRLKGFDYNGGDGTITRRDPTRPIKVGDTYYLWYTKRHTKVRPIGWNNAAKATDKIPSTDWDLAEVWYATSKDGFTWEEKGVAIKRPEKPKSGWRSVCTPEILIWKGKYYLYYQAFDEPSGLKGDLCPVSISYADSPDGPWIHGCDAVIPFGKEGEWDHKATHDPFPIVHNGKIYVYYKSAFNKWPDNRSNYAVGHGLAIADDPLGPYTKHPLNPINTSGHETTYFPYKEGIASIIYKDGNDRETVQYAKDGVNFEIMSKISLVPIAGGPYTPDAFTDTKNGRGITWGISHFINAGTNGKRYSILARFDCDLSLDYNEPALKKSGVWHKPDVYFKQGLGNLKHHPEGR